MPCLIATRRGPFNLRYSKNKPLCFSARAYQQPHPAKVRMGYKDADATLTSPMLLGVCGPALRAHTCHLARYMSILVVDLIVDVGCR